MEFATKFQCSEMCEIVCGVTALCRLCNETHSCLYFYIKLTSYIKTTDAAIIYIYIAERNLHSTVLEWGDLIHSFTC